MLSKIRITLIYERKRIRLQFRNLFALCDRISALVRLHYVTAYILYVGLYYLSRLREANIKKLSGCNKTVFLSVLQLHAPCKSFIERYGVIDW
jgi:hypothetical protein